MGISTYAELKTAIATWALRTGDSDFVTRTIDCITLAEAKLSRLLGGVEADTTLTGTSGSRSIATGLTIYEPIALFLAQADQDEIPIQIQASGTFAYLDTEGQPSVASFSQPTAGVPGAAPPDGGEVPSTWPANIDFDVPLDAAYPFRLRYRGRLALSSGTTTNWLLSNHPDVYLAASMVWGAGYQEDWPNGAMWKGLLEEAIPEIRHILARQRKGTLRVDPALVSPRSTFNVTTGQ